ncbi:hypothetical protein PVAG01_10535 [Phlyctema vagabunda]|uniref:Uncharacterized protein n=1 Tax=Phlyctema vagabunda TaxID=108571 RepID=A0ABR4P2J4_9HELO
MDGIRQTTGNRYLKRASLQKLLEEKFGKMDFKIILQDDQFIFTAPEEVSDEELE